MTDLKKIRINEKTEFDCINANDYDGNKFLITLNCNDYNTLSSAFREVEKIELLDADGLVCRMETKYQVLDSIKALMTSYLNSDGDFMTCFEIILSEMNFQEQIKILTQKISPIIDESKMSMEELKDYKIKQLGESCTAAIYAGTEVETSNGTEKFSYRLEDQSNLKDLYITASATSLPCPYHSDSSLCAIYPAEDITKIYFTLSRHKLYHTAYANALNTYVRSLRDKSIISSVFYGQEIPEEYKDHMENILQQGQTAITALSSKHGISSDDEQNESPI